MDCHKFAETKKCSEMSVGSHIELDIKRVFFHILCTGFFRYHLPAKVAPKQTHIPIQNRFREGSIMERDFGNNNSSLHELSCNNVRDYTQFGNDCSTQVGGGLSVVPHLGTLHLLCEHLLKKSACKWGRTHFIFSIGLYRLSHLYFSAKGLHDYVGSIYVRVMGLIFQP